MTNRKFYLQGKDLVNEINRSDKSLRIEWNMLYKCNYRCPHCIFEGKWQEYEKRNRFASVAELLEIWKKIFKDHGRGEIIVTGGEPFLYPNFIELIKELSQIHYPINISTNSSGDLKRFVEHVSPKRVSLTLSFQPEFDRIEAVLERKKFLKRSGFYSDYINFCAYPSYLDKLEEYTTKAALEEEHLKVIPYNGIYNGINYPDGYTDKEKKMLGMNIKWEQNVRKKGTLCAAGQKSALIYPDGNVSRCGQIGEKLVIGNIFERGFHLLEKPMICDADICPCAAAIPVES
jgi:MoaA/NifB/PqqE/SkfB family radical SAM enzyme